MPALDEPMRDRLERLTTQLTGCGASIDEITLPAKFDNLVEAHSTILEVELAPAFHELENYPDSLTESLYCMLERGRFIDYGSYLAAQRLAAECRWESSELFDNHDVLLASSV